MASIGGFDSNSMNVLFSNFGSSTNSASSTNNGLLGINLSDYTSIKNGSYGKLMKSYYGLEENKNSKDTNTKNDTDDTDAVLKSIKSSSASLKESAADLYADKALFEKNADGEYDMEAIYEKVNAFLEDYNEMLESVGSAETESIAKAGANVVNAASCHVDLLSKVGISINKSDYSLSIDKEKFQAANISDMKSLFSGVGSFAYQIGSKASRLENLTAEKLPKNGSYLSKGNSSSSTSKDTASTIAKIKEHAQSLVSSSTELYKNRKLFDKDLEGAYNTDAIVEEISAFIKDYNDLIASGENTKSSGITNALKGIDSISDAYEKELKALGITQNEDNTLKLDEDIFRASDMKSAKELFIGTGSFAYQISVKAAMAASQAETEANKSNTYTGNANYSNNYNTGTIFNNFV